MRTRRANVLAVSTVLLILAAGTVVAQTELQPGTVVFGEWFENQWYRGTVQESCRGGFIIRAETGETKCVSLNKIVLDVVPETGQVTQGVPVLAEWAPGQFYPGVVSAIRGSSYDIQYDDGDRSTVRLTGLRLQGNHDAEGATVIAETESNTLEQAITIRREGREWAEIEADGTVMVHGSSVGRITAGGMVYRRDRVAGQVDSDGLITIDDRQVGEIEMNGRLWRGGSPIGSVIVNGDLYLGGSKWAESNVSSLDYSDQRVLAALVAFFAPEFGFVR
ncbi:MAG: hypothetical protein PF508_02940 [Spirochaeta sp.]|nr:hypothetical protein [Spirochaeta sp.]